MKRCARCREIKPLEQFHRDATTRSPDGRKYRCKACIRSDRAAYYARNRDNELAQMKAWYAANIDRERDRIRGNTALRNAANRARSDAEIAADRAALRPDGTKRCRACKVALPFDQFHTSRVSADGLFSRCRDCESVRAARRWATTLGDMAAYWTSQGIDPAACYICGTVLGDEVPMHIDHLVPSARGGTDDLVNLLPACSPHNRSKSDQDVLHWLPLKYEHRREWIASRVAACAEIGIVFDATLGRRSRRLAAH